LKDGSVKNIVGGDQLQPDDLFAYGSFLFDFLYLCCPKIKDLKKFENFF
jgi:hypothetical protein